MSDEASQPVPEGLPPIEVGAEWLRGEGESVDVVMSSRVRLARNLAGFRFALKATPADRQQTLELCRERIVKPIVRQSRIRIVTPNTA